MVEEPRPLTTGRLLLRGLTRRCPLCGSGDTFASWFRMRTRCPRCNFPFERIEGHWIGALGMNTVVSFGLLLVTLAVGFVLTWPEPPVVTLTAAGLAVAILVPFLFFPFSRTLWSAIDLLMRPPSPEDDIDPRWIPPVRATRGGLGR